MEEWIGGKPSKDTRPILRQKTSNVIQNSLHKNIESQSIDVLKILKKSAKGLKKVDLIRTRSKIEYNKYEYSSEPAFLWQEEYIASFNFFVTILGYIDKMINIEKDKIDFNSHFIDPAKSSKEEIHKIRISESNKRIKKFKKDRQEVLEGYYSVIKDKTETLIIDTLNTCPSYDKFLDLYKDGEKHIFQMNLQQNLVIAYNNGYVYDITKYEKVLNKYRYLFNELIICKENNKAIVEGVKKKQKVK